METTAIPEARWREAAEALRAQQRDSLAWFPDPTKVIQQNWYTLVAADLTDLGPPSARWDFMSVFSLVAALIALPRRAAFATEILALDKLLRVHPGSLYPRGTQMPMLCAMFEEYLAPEDRWSVDMLLESAGVWPSALNPTADPEAVTAQLMARSAAVSALWTFGLVGDARDSRVIDVLMSALTDVDKQRAVLAGLALAELGVAAATAPLIELLRRTREDDAVKALGMLRASAAVEPLLEALRQSRRTARPAFSVLATALGRIGDRRASAALAPHLSNRNLALPAAMALHQLGDDQGMPIIVAAATRPSTPDWEAARRLLQLGDPRGLAALQIFYRESGMTRDRLLRDISRHGTLLDIPLLEWVRANDFDQTTQGWSLAEEASRAIERITMRLAARPHLAD